MLGRKPGKKTAQAKGRGAAAAKELGLFVDFSPEDMMLGIPDDPDDGDLEAELAALTGVKAASKLKPKGKAPLPMEEIEKMAQDCMKDMTGEDDDDLEEDEELLAELQEVVGEEEEVEQSLPSDTEESELSAPEKQEHTEPEHQVNYLVAEIQHSSQIPAGGMLQVLEQRISNYKEAISNAKLSNESAKARRYERGLKTLESMLSVVRQGRSVIEADIPPPVAYGKPTVSPKPDVPITDTSIQELGDLNVVPMETTEGDTNLETPEDPASKAITNDGGAEEKTHVVSQNDTDSKTLLLLRQREYKLAALKAKQTGDFEKAKEYMKISKKFSVVFEALESGQPVDLSNMPAAPEDHEALVTESKIPAYPTPAPPVSNISNTQGPLAGSLLQALQQRMEKYKSAAQQAKSSGDDRKARMHERIAKQYQDAIRAHKAGRQVNLSELPVPPGFPPLSGMEQTEEERSVEKALEAAQKLAKTAGNDEDDDDEDECQSKPQGHSKPTQLVKPIVMPAASDSEETSLPIRAQVKIASEEKFPPAVQEQLEFLEHRKKQYRKAALQAKQKNDLEQAKRHMRVAHTLQVSIDHVKSGKLVDISKVPSLPDDEESDFVVVEYEDIKSPQNSEDVYNMLMKLLHEQHEKCICYSKQFTQMGNVAETTRFEKMAEDCKKNCEILQLSQAQGLDPPPYHFEDKTLKIVRVFSELSSTEMLLIIVRGINLPAPSGVAPNDLDAYVKFEFPYPSSEQPQKNKTLVIKNTNSPEYEQSFKLNINRNHRGFKRVIQTKGMKFEIFHKGFFLVRSDKQVGSASVKLDKLETQCEIREIVEVFDGRKPTGGKLEIKVRLRDPLNGQDLQVVTEKWLVMGQVPRKKRRKGNHPSCNDQFLLPG
ncbi:coiled-coil and C2 domain-containing protein 1B-like isoform X2 [Xenopus laevis]|uniref:Coiled-coil and C2 domain-containing protein 1B n=1 Tax=Xenopus laevis TaxID=8355 RepID=A0A8J0V7K3_XENLA|nr:coiled-coil and C2 domain-containing protein 1B-like isoform X2 [Xenopus laevis]